MESILTTSSDLLELQSNYSLTDVEPTGKKRGEGAYGYVEEVRVNGATCAAKKVHRVLLNHRNEGVENFKRKFFSECVIMSKLRHPHIVQFLGVYFPSDSQRKAEEELESSSSSKGTPLPHPQGLLLPWLIMELLPTNLSNFLEKRVNIPYSVRVSLLADISKGLCYLHSQKPTIIHRDLTANNILINSALVAKIADFGVARITNPMSSSMSVGPGAIAYMPPEVQDSGEGNHASYSFSVDVFSFGVIILYTIIQKAPLNIKAATYVNSSRGLVALTEVQRREKHFNTAQECLPDRSAPEYELIALSKSCLDNEASSRPTSCHILVQLNALKKKIPDQLLDTDKFQLMQMAAMCNGVVAGREAHSPLPSPALTPLQTEVQHLRIRLQQLETERMMTEGDKQRLQDDKRQLEEDRRRLEAQLVLKDQEISHQVTMGIADERRRRADFESMQAELQGRLDQERQSVERLTQQLNMEREISETRKQGMELQDQQIADLKAQLVEVESRLQQPPTLLGSTDQEKERLKNTIESLKNQIMQRDNQIAAVKKEAQLLRDEHIRTAEENQGTIERLSKELEVMKREMKARSPHHSMTPASLPPSLPESGIKVRLPLFWKNCLPTPSSVHCGQCVLFGTNILYGGGTGLGDNKRKIMRFDLRKLKWEEFSLYLYEYFSMAVVLGKLLVVGGYDSMKDEYSNRLSEWRDVGSNWVRIGGSPLPVPRSDAVAVGYKKWLIVAGGFNGAPMDRVDLLDCENFGPWHSLGTPLPKPAYALQSAFHYDSQSGAALWYLTSTNRGCGLSRQRSVYFIAVNQLIERRGTWQVLPEPPLCNSAPVTVRGHLLVVGGHDQHSCKRDVHMYFFGTSEWLKVAELQNARHSCSCVPLSDRKFVVIGGQDEEAEFSCRVSQYNITYAS